MTADKIKALREAKGWTQADLARKLGITRNGVNSWEQGLSTPSPACLVDLATLGGVIMSVQDPVPENILLTVVCIVLAVLLLKKRKRKEPEVLRTSETSTPLVSVKTELTQPDVPEDTLRDMRKYYSTMQAENDARIMRESFQLCQQTFAYETFFSRLQLAERKALTLLQAKKAGCKVDEQMLKAAESVLSAVDALKTDFLGRIYTKETTEAMRLKTQAGQNRRLEAFVDELQGYENDFMTVEDDYNKIIKGVQALMS